MKNKMLITVYVPMIEQNYDIYIPVVKKIGVIKRMIMKIVEEATDGAFVADDTKNLYDKVTGDLYNDDEFIKYSKIKNGSRLILY